MWRLGLVLGVLLHFLSATASQAQEVRNDIAQLVFPSAELVFPSTQLAERSASLAKPRSGIQISETDREVRIEMAGDILFDFDRASLRASATPALQQAASVIRERARGTVRIEGHTDGRGGRPYNQRLSEARANSVAEWLHGPGGLRATRFETVGYGPDRPAAPNAHANGQDNPDGRQRNRRVEIVLDRR